MVDASAVRRYCAAAIRGRRSTAVVQRFCKPKVGSSILSAGTISFDPTVRAVSRPGRRPFRPRRRGRAGSPRSPAPIGGQVDQVAIMAHRQHGTTLVARDVDHRPDHGLLGDEIGEAVRRRTARRASGRNKARRIEAGGRAPPTASPSPPEPRHPPTGRSAHAVSAARRHQGIRRGGRSAGTWPAGRRRAAEGRRSLRRAPR